MFHSLSCFTKRAKRSVKSVPFTETLRTSVAVDEGVTLKIAHRKNFELNFVLSVVVDKKDPYETISTKRLSIEMKIKCDVKSLRCDSEIDSINRDELRPCNI